MAGNYLSPMQVNWDPQTEEDLAQAIKFELLEETHHLELKALIPSGTRANKELAQDLAQFAIDGGVILIGIAESADALMLAPVSLDGLCERIEQIAQTRIDPPLFTSCREIRAVSDASRGYVLASVPPSPYAPHMVDGKYPARGDKSRRYLSDFEVTRYHQARQRPAAAVNSLLDDYIVRDPVPPELRQGAHLYVVATPTHARPEMLLPIMDGSNTQVKLMGLISAASIVPGLAQNSLLPPSLSSVHSPGRRADGIAVTSGLTKERLPAEGDVERIVEVEFGEEGTLRVLNTRLSGDKGNGEQRILGSMFPQMVRQTVNLASVVSSSVGYSGAWDLGVAATGLAGLPLWVGHAFWEPPVYPADQDEYRATTSAYSSELHRAAGEVTGRLVGRYLRTLNLELDSDVRQFLS